MRFGHLDTPLRLTALLTALALAACEPIPAPRDEDEPQPEDTPPETFPIESDPMAPIVGGGLLVTVDERLAIAADLDRDVLWVADLDTNRPHGRIPLEAGDRPNRLVEDADRRVHVALRRGGAVVSVDPEALTILRRTAVCPAPRGIAYDIDRDALWVACLHGALVELDPTTHAERRRITVAPDLRDVVIDGERVLVSTFRSAEVFAVASATGAVEPAPAAQETYLAGTHHVPRVAWRMVAGPDGGPLLLHQRHQAAPLPELESPVVYYASGFGCSSAVVHTTLAPLGDLTREPLGRLLGAPIDLAVGAGGRIAVADPWVDGPVDGADSGCGETSHVVIGDGAVAVGWRGAAMVAFVPQRALIKIVPPIEEGIWGTPRSIAFDARPLANTGHRLFHEPTRTGISCAACHPEGGEDGHTWIFEAFGPRRTQGLRGGISDRAPFHWSGDLADFGALMTEVFESRMGGAIADPAQGAALAGWLDTVPHLPRAPALDPPAIERGRAIFDGIGCRECHYADGRVDPDSHDVGTGERLQVPSLLGVSLRLPLMHDGCAPSLAARFDPACGGDQHGATADLDAAARADLVAFIESL